MQGLLGLLFLVMIVFGGAFVDPSCATRTLTAHGFSDIKVTDHSWFVVGLRGGDVGDIARFTAEVTNCKGQRTKVYVFTGFLKYSTVRVE
jgi:hypothetical protein